VGGTSFWLAETLGTKVSAISISPKQIDHAKKLALTRDQRGLVEFSIRDYTETRFPDNYFDVVWAQESIPHAQDKEQFLREAYRVLKKGGRLITADYFIGRESKNDEEKALMKNFMDSWAMPTLVTPQTFVTLAEKTGFMATHYDTTKLAEPSLRRLKHTCHAFRPLAFLLRRAGLRNKINDANMMSGIWGHEAMQKGLWKHGMIYAEK
jgi:ubiquinone/menaquinone biosynthesis C-methylase UbiE